MSLHTPGKIVFRPNGDANSYAMLDEAGHWWMSLLMNGEQITARQEANLRRMAACWNACADESTEFLEFVVHEGTTLRKRHDSVLTMKETYQRQLCDAERQIEALQARLTAIGDLAHDKSTGPAVPDVLWEIRSMAHGEHA